MALREAIVLKQEKNRISVLTGDGEFRSVRWLAPLPQPGEEVLIWVPPLSAKQLLAVALAAAFLLVAVLPAVAWARKPAAYIALDINPSIGLEVARSGKIKSSEGLNDEGEKLVRQVAVRGLLPPEAVKQLVEQAARDGYVTNSTDDVIVISQVCLQSAPLPTLPELEQAAERGLQAAGKEAFVAVEEASPEELAEARKQKTSLNQMRLLKKLDYKPSPPSLKGDTKSAAQKEGLKEILAGSGKKAAEVFQTGSHKGQPKPPWASKKTNLKPKKKTDRADKKDQDPPSKSHSPGKKEKPSSNPRTNQPKPSKNKPKKKDPPAKTKPFPGNGGRRS